MPKLDQAKVCNEIKRTEDRLEAPAIDTVKGLRELKARLGCKQSSQSSIAIGDDPVGPIRIPPPGPDSTGKPIHNPPPNKYSTGKPIYNKPKKNK